MTSDENSRVLTKQPTMPYVWVKHKYIGGTCQIIRAWKVGNIDFYLKEEMSVQ
jgi:glutaredoxin-related protein